MEAPLITIFVRHSQDCKYVDMNLPSVASASSISVGPCTENSIAKELGQKGGRTE
jgi:hypothetical protein